MKKIYYLATAMTLATMVGCQNENEIPSVQNESGKTFYASFEGGVDSRTALSGENNKVVWLDGDRLSVFAGTTTNTPYKLSSGANETFGTFTFEQVSGGTESNGSSASTLSANVAYYPYDENVTVNENNGSFTFNATFPTEQTYSESGTFGNGASPMVAVTTTTLDASFMFKNVGGIFRLQLQGDATITKIVFSAAGANLAGKCQITASNANGSTAAPTVSVTEGSNSITLDCGDGVSLSSSTPTNFVVAMLPVSNVSGGLTISIYDADGKKMTYTHKDANAETFSLERSKAKTTTLVTYDGTETAVTNETNLKAALTAATETNSTITVEDDITLEKPLSVENGKDVTIDLNGQILTFTASTSTLSTRSTTASAGIVNSGTLTLQNGTINYTCGEYVKTSDEIAAIVNKGTLKLDNVNVNSDIYCVKTFGTWTTGNTLQDHTGEPTVTTTITGGTYTSTGSYHGTNGAHIYAIYAQDFAKTSISGATIKGDGGIAINCSVVDLSNNAIEATDASTYGVFMNGAANVTASSNNTYTTQSGTSVLAYGGDNATYGKIVYNDKVLNYADATTMLEVPEGVSVLLEKDATGNWGVAPTLNGKIINNGTLTIKDGTINYNYSDTYEGYGKVYDETSAIVNKGVLTLSNTNVSSNVWAVKTFGTWTNNVKLEAQGEPTVKTTINGGEIVSSATAHSQTGAHIYAISNVDNALLTINGGAKVEGDGGIYMNCSKVAIDNATLTANCTTSANCIYIGGAGIATVANTTMTAAASAKVVAFANSNAEYGNITYNGETVTIPTSGTAVVVVK